MTAVIVVGLGYLLGMPLLLRLICQAHTEIFIKQKQAKMPKTKAAAANLPQPLWPRLSQRMKFTWKDSRPFSLKKSSEASETAPTNDKIFKIILVSGLILSILFAFMKMWMLIPVAYLLFFVAVGISSVTAAPLLKAREQLFVKMFEIGKARLGIPADESPQKVIEILEWRDLLKPSKVKFVVPTTFSSSGEEAFQQQFNQIFGTDSAWVPAFDAEKGTPGWDYDNGFVTLKEMPPLPTAAPWEEHYVLDPSVAWSFFPIGLGVENGIELTNPNTGQKENVLGFDVSGIQPGLSKEMGTYCSPRISTSPMSLIAGGTGGGKSLAVDTKIKVVKKG